MSVDQQGLGPSQRTLVEERRKAEANKDVANAGQKRHEKVGSECYHKFYFVV